MTTQTALSQAIQDLPQELFDSIYNQTFTAVPGLRIINASYRPPNLLCIDRASREKFAASYYGRGNVFQTHKENQLYQWLASLTVQHRALITSVRVDWRKTVQATAGKSMQGKLERLRITVAFLMLQNRLNELNVPVRGHGLWISYVRKGEEEEVRWLVKEEVGSIHSGLDEGE